MIKSPPWQRQRPPYPTIQNPCQTTLKGPGQTRDKMTFHHEFDVPTVRRNPRVP